jgi:exodeoxyribonuclease V beta subunit
MSEFTQVVFTPGLNLAAPLLVEASAGTGKTYNIQNVYLRLILQERLTVQQILVVTYTNAATQELRERLRSILLQCRYELDFPAGANPTPEQRRIQDALVLANPGQDPLCAANLKKPIQIALMDFDAAAIFTIHGFCKRVLERFAFECGHDPDAELMADQSGIIIEACQDWWRQQAYNQEAQDIPFQSLGELIALVFAAYKHPIAKLKGSALPDSNEFKAFVGACQTVLESLESLRGKIVWLGGGRLCRAQKATADAAPIADLAVPYATTWEENMRGNTSSLAVAVSEVLQTVRAFPGAGDAIPFAKHLKTIAESGLESANLSKQAAIAGEISRNVRERIRDRAALTYDAMLVNVRTVLQDGTAGPHLRNLLRGEFKAALIDEFQDTDPVQYDIFQSLFGPGQDPTEPRLPLVFVGDPKQAIYGFRGGDVFTYYQAKEAIPAGDRHSLGENYRSEAHLVAAINELFKDDPPGTPTFLNPNVAYAEDLAAHDIAAEKELLVDGRRDKQPLKIWRLSEDAQDQWADSVARETVRILSDGKQTIDGKQIQPQQIAVLVMTHPEAAKVQQALLDAGVNAVRQATGNVFDSEVAAPLALVMQALLEPSQAGIVRSALCSGLLPCTPAQIARFKAEEDAACAPQEAQAPDKATCDSSDPPVRFEEWIEVFHEAGLRWDKYSFVDGFQYLSNQLEIPAHVARQPEGSRRLSDLRHLVELAHQAARSLRLGPVALLGWFVRQLDSDRRDAAGEDDDAKPRIAHDDDAVRIMTIFKSKGLQFPIVFVPTLWKSKSQAKHGKAKLLKYHENNELVLDLDVKSAGAQEIAMRENHEERIRLAYVALTRAINRTYLFESGANAEPADFAVAHLLQRLPVPEAEGEVRQGHILRRHVPTDLPEGAWTGATRPTPESLQARELEHFVDHSQGHASFSSLAPHAAAKSTESGVRNRDEETAAAPEAESPDPASIFSIPGGAKLGECWHEIFENIDFEDRRKNPDAIRLMVNQTLDKYRICPEPRDILPADKRAAALARRAAVHAMVENTLSVPLQADPAETPFALQEIPRPNRRSEMEFNFSLQRNQNHTVRGVADILAKHWREPARNEDFIADLATRNSSIPQGFMTGFIDLAFQRNGRFYVVDWKSNRLNARADGFGPEGLAAEMRKHSYYLQYLIYVAALHGFLSGQLKGYDYDHHFGGVFYLFLRGIDGKSPNGVFSDKPSRALVEALSIFLGGPS